MKIRTFAVAIALAGTPAVLAAQQTPAPRGDHAGHGQLRGARGGFGEGRERGALRALLAHRQQLNLTDAQVSRLTAISQRLESQNAPLMQRLQTLRQQSGLPERRAFRRAGQGQGQQGQWQGQQGRQRQRGERPQLTEQQRQAMQQFRQQAQPIMQQIRQNTQAAMREGQAVLTQQQRQQIQQLMQQRRGERGGRGEGWQGRRGQQQAQPRS